MNVHLDDEELSALLDGEADGRAQEHLGSCDRCAARLAQLQAAAHAVAEPPSPLPPGRRAAIIAAALGAPSGSDVGSPPEAPPPAPLRRSLATARPWMAAAAAVVAVAAAVPVVRSQLDTPRDVPTAAGNSAAGTTVVPGAEAADEARAATELGEIDLGTLRSDRAAVEELAARLVERRAPGGGDAPAAALRQAAPPSGEESAAPSYSAGDSRCEAHVRGNHHELLRLVGVAGGTVEGVAVDVLGFDALADPEGDDRPDRLVVVDRSSCAELAVVDVER